MTYESFRLYKEVLNPDYLEVASNISGERLETLGESFVGDLVLPLPYSSSETFTEDTAFLLLQNLL